MANPKSIFWVLFALSAVLLALPAVYSQDDSEIPLTCAPPSVIEIGRRYTIDVAFRNRGESVWTAAAGYGLGLIDVIGVECRGDKLNPQDYIAWNQTKTFRLSCIPIPGEENRTTMMVRMSHDGEYFGETGMPCTKYFFKVVNNCWHGAINDMCNKYCGADDECHNQIRNNTFYVNASLNGFCSFECEYSDEPPPGWGTTTTTTAATTTTQAACPEGYVSEGGLCVYYPASSIFCPAGSTYSSTYDLCISYPNADNTCPEGFRLENGLCLFYPTSGADCPPGTTFSEYTCVFYANTSSACPEGYDRVNNLCVYQAQTRVECPEASTYSESAAACVIYPEVGQQCPQDFRLENSLCIYLLSRTCGNLQVDDNELCDYSSDVPNWKTQRSKCNTTMTMSLSTCSMGCQPKYYAPMCIAAQCGAECAGNSQCNDNDSKTSDRCDTSTCKCNYVLISSQSAPSKIITILRVLIVILGAAALVLFVVYVRMGMRLKRAARKTEEGKK